MKKKMIIILVVAMVFLVTACSASEGSEAGTVLSIENTEAALPVDTQLVLGSLLLESSDQAIDSELAATLLPYWKMYLSLKESDSTAEAELNALVADIQGVMSQEQIAYITELELTQDSMKEAMEELGIMETIRPEGAESDGEGRPESMPEEMTEGMGQGADGDIDPDMLANMQSEREGSGEGSDDSRMIGQLVEALVSLLESKAG